jgi:hypothetical protein
MMTLMMIMSPVLKPSYQQAPFPPLSSISLFFYREELQTTTPAASKTTTTATTIITITTVDTLPSLGSLLLSSCLSTISGMQVLHATAQVHRVEFKSLPGRLG